MRTLIVVGIILTVTWMITLFCTPPACGQIIMAYGRQTLEPSRNIVYISADDAASTVKTKIEAADTGSTILIAPSWYTWSDQKINVPMHCTIVGNPWYSDVFITGTDSLFLLTTSDINISFGNVSIITSGPGSFITLSDTGIVTFDNCYIETAGMIADSGYDFRLFNCHTVPTAAPVKTRNAERGVIATQGGSLDLKGGRLGYDKADRQAQVKDVYGVGAVLSGKFSWAGIENISANIGTAVIWCDSSGGVSIFNSMIQAIGTCSYAIKAIGGYGNTEKVTLTNMAINGSIWSQDSAVFIIKNTAVAGDVRLGGSLSGSLSNYWTNSSLSSSSDTFTFAIEPDTAGPLYIDNLDGVKSNGGVWCDSTRAVPYGNSPTVGLFVYIAHGSCYAQYNLLEGRLLVNTPGLVSGSNASVALYSPNTFMNYGALGTADTLLPVITINTNQIQLDREAGSATWLATSGKGCFFEWWK